jgi:serine/threonine protein kinase
MWTERESEMRDLMRQIVEGYRALQLEGQDQGYVVFSAQDPDSRESLSIKVLPRLLGDDPQIAHRFQALARAIRRLNHPNIVPVRKVGDESGLPYLVTRALEKVRPLTDRLDQPWAVDAAADLVMQVGAALEHAYQKGVIHGHLTPEDIALEGDGRVLVSNLGLGELLSLVGAQVEEVASPFVAPERVEGQHPQAPADVYSLGAILYTLLAHRPPQVVAGQVLPPGRFNPDVPQAMDQVVVKALAPDPAQRYSDVAAFVAALGSVSLVAPRQAPLPSRAGRTCARCGTANQTGRFCRHCGARLEPREAPEASARDQTGRRDTRPVSPQKSVLDEPIQITRIEVGIIEVGKGIEVQDTVIAQPMEVASGEVGALFPELLPMPQLDLHDLWPGTNSEPAVVMPQPPPMPTVDWGEIAPPMPEVPTIEDIPINTESD